MDAPAAIGTVEQVSGPVVDVACEGQLPALRDALHVQIGGAACTLEVYRHLDHRRLRAVALDHLE